MPIYPRTYRHWEGPLGGPLARLRAFAVAGLQVAWRGKWLRRIMLLTGTPVVVTGAIFFLASQVLEPEAGMLGRAVGGDVGSVLGAELGDELRRDPGAQAALWGTLLYLFLAWTQTFIVLLVVAMVGPGLVAADLRHQAHEIYFARPVGWWDYVLGKLAVVAVFVGAVTLLPALLLYAESILVSPSLSSLWHTWHFVPRLVLIWLLWSVATGLPILALSSLGPSSRLTSFLWIAGWIGSYVLSWVIRLASMLAEVSAQEAGGRHGPGPDWNAPHWSNVLSYHDNLLAVAYGILGVEGHTTPYRTMLRGAETLQNQTPGQSPWVALAVLGGACLLSLAVLRWRVRPEGAA